MMPAATPHGAVGKLAPRLDHRPLSNLPRSEDVEDPSLSCPFCAPNDGTWLGNAFAYVRCDLNPVTPGHLLLIPFRHVSIFFDINGEERDAILELLGAARTLVDEIHQPDGYNIGINIGAAAGQTVDHVHLHLIPRYRGDVDAPRGGVRGVIPSKQTY